MAGHQADSKKSGRATSVGRQRPRGRPRSDEAEETILSVACDLLAEGGFTALNYDELAARARCSKATIYRRWPTKGHLAVAALAELPDPPPTPDRGELRVELRELLDGILSVFTHSPAIPIMQSLIGERAGNPKLSNLLDEGFKKRRLGLLQVLRRAIERGDLSAETDLELLMDLIVGPILCRYFCTGEPVSGAFLDHLVESVLSGQTLQPA